MLKLCGFAASNYYNKVKLAMLEKDIPFEEELVWGNETPGVLEKSPLGKVPYLETAQGTLSESQALIDYLEAAYPDKPLMPADPFAAAKVRELMIFMELYLELPARELYPQAFFGKEVSQETIARVEKTLKRGAEGFAKLAKFSPYIAGDTFTAADCAALAHLPLVGMASKAVLGTDVLADFSVRDYTRMLGERATVQKLVADRKVNQELMKARAQK